MIPAEHKRAIAHLKKHDQILAKIIDRVPPFERNTATGNYFFDLTDAIISQQLSIKAASTILKRFQALFPDGKITPERVVTLESGIVFER